MTLRPFIVTLIATAATCAQAARIKPGDVSLHSVELVGGGCPQGTVAATLAPDASALTILYTSFQAEVNATRAADRKNCDVVLKFTKPENVVFAIESADFRGYLFLDKGARASQRTRIESGHGDFAEANADLGERSWVGPVNKNYLLKAIRPAEGERYLNCKQQNRKLARMRIKSVITLENGGRGAQGLMSVDSVDGRVIHKYNLKWVDCQSAPVPAMPTEPGFPGGISPRR